MGKKNLQKIYVVIIFLVVLIPVFTMNRKENQISIIDNDYLPELPAWEDNSLFFEELDNYVDKRIGFREKAIYLYETGVAQIFNKLEHPSYMFGKEGHIMGSVQYYLDDYQHLNTGESYEVVEAFAGYLSRVNTYLSQNNIEFLYFLAPDKKTIYYDYYPDYVNVYWGASKTDLLLSALDKNEIPYIYPKERFLQEREFQQIYNLKYDVFHWNDLGNFIGNQMIDEQLRSAVEGIEPLSREQYNLTYECEDMLTQSCYYIYEDVPVYYLKSEEGILDVSEQDEYLKENVTNLFEHYVNENKKDAPCILIMHDSYFGKSCKFYKHRYSEVISVHVENYDNIKELVEHYHPDIVVFETVERIIRPNPPFFDVSTLDEWE